jgi:hypothetical protein
MAEPLEAAYEMQRHIAEILDEFLGGGTQTGEDHVAADHAVAFDWPTPWAE